MMDATMGEAPSVGARDAVLRFWLLYTVVWGAATGAVMVTGLAERWGDPALLAFGVALAVPALVGPVVLAPDRSLPWWRRTATKLGVAVAAFAVLMNWSQTPFFFEVLHMRYGFRVEWVLQGNPVFLYLLTIPYFATYCALGLLGLGRARRVRQRWARIALTAAIPFALAAAETALNANPFTERLFCYDDPGFALGFGTVVYGGTLSLALWVWGSIGVSTAWRTVALRVFAAMYAIVLLLDVARYGVAPHLTDVGVRPPEDSCLLR